MSRWMTDKAFSFVYFRILKNALYHLRIPRIGANPLTKQDFKNVDHMVLLMDGHGSHVYDHVVLTQTLLDKVCKLFSSIRCFYMKMHHIHLKKRFMI